MIVETKVVGRRTPFERRSVLLPDGPHTLRGLLTLLARQEVGAYNERQGGVGLLRVLTEKELNDGVATGVVRIAPQERTAPAHADEAVHNVLRAFGDGLYYVFVDDEQVGSLDQPLKLRPDSTLLLLRLTALAGG